MKNVENNALKSVILATLVSLIFCIQTFGLKIGYYDNFPLCYEENGEPKGLFIDILKKTFDVKSEKIEFVFGEFSDLLEELRTGKIDILTVVADTQERRNIYKFNEEPVLTNWGVLVTNVPFNDIQELNGKKVAVNRGDIYYNEFKKLMNSFGIEVYFDEFDTYYDVLSNVNDGKYNFGVVSRLSYLVNSEKVPNVRQTSYVFSPVLLKFAFKKDIDYIFVQEIDRTIRNLKSNGEFEKLFNSYFLMKENKKFEVPGYLWIIIIVFLIASLGVVYLSHKISMKKLKREYERKIEGFREGIVKSSNENVVLNDKIYSKTFGIILSEKYSELAKRENRLLSVLVVKVENLEEKNRNIFENVLNNVIREGDFAFKYSENEYVIILFSYAAFVLESFRRILREKLLNSGFDIQFSLGFKVYNSEENRNIEKVILDALFEASKNSAF